MPDELRLDDQNKPKRVRGMLKRGGWSHEVRYVNLAGIMVQRRYCILSIQDVIDMDSKLAPVDGALSVWFFHAPIRDQERRICMFEELYQQALPSPQKAQEQMYFAIVKCFANNIPAELIPSMIEKLEKAARAA